MSDFIRQKSTVYDKNDSMPIISLKRGYIHMRYSPVNPYISLASHFGDIGKQCRPRSDAADQDIHCLLPGISIRNIMKNEKVHQTTLILEMELSN